MAIYSGFSHEKWWFSIAMLNYQRVWLFIDHLTLVDDWNSDLATSWLFQLFQSPPLIKKVCKHRHRVPVALVNPLSKNADVFSLSEMDDSKTPSVWIPKCKIYIDGWLRPRYFSLHQLFWCKISFKIMFWTQHGRFSAGTDPVGGRAIGRSTSVNLFQGKLSHLFVCMPKKRNPKSHCSSWYSH